MRWEPHSYFSSHLGAECPAEMTEGDFALPSHMALLDLGRQESGGVSRYVTWRRVVHHSTPALIAFGELFLQGSALSGGLVFMVPLWNVCFGTTESCPVQEKSFL
ncbi:unnamed protein product [Pipistrellus nathusii]|uniref:Uncharacterized protein n=1 Tax=Pipistrellus nathusii TaxID=59473 RepID=A0ABP0AB73_PIPNA